MQFARYVVPMASTSEIRPLQADVATQIKSSIGITSLNGVVLELLKNSLDACSRKIRIEIDYGRGACTVEDDGLGIPPNEFKEEGGLLKLHHTSRYNSSTPCHGSRGTFLASLAALSLLSITSHHHLHNSHNTISVNRSKVIARQTPAPQICHISTFKHGTRVTVRDLFGNMPVRIKQRTVGLTGPSGNWREWEELRRGLTGLLLAWTTSVNVSVNDSASSQKMQMRGAIAIDSLEKLESEIGFLTHMCSLLSQAGFITPAEKTSWISIRASTRKLSILGAISLEPAPTKTVQFISFGINPIFSKDGGNILYLDINRLFRNSYFGNEDISYAIYDKKKEEVSENPGCRKDIFTKMELKNPRKGIDKCPMFVIKIQSSSLGTSYSGNDVDSLMYGKEGVLDSITELLSEMIVEFLRAHNFLPRSAPPSCFSGHDHQGEEDCLHSKTHADLETVRIGQKIESHTGFKVGLPLVTQTNSKWSGSPFDSWPRVKQGKRMHAAKESTDSNGRTPRRLKCPVLKCGKVVRQPFDDLPPLTSKSLEFRDWSENDLTSWTNPITKTKHLVNSRTGFVVPSINLGEQAVYQQSGYMKDIQSRSPPVYEGSKHEKIHLERNQTPWINEILRNWDNPVFRPMEPEIPQISYLNRICGEVNQTQYGRRQNFALLGIDKLSGGRNGRLSKDTLRQAEIISQVDKKFILTKIWRKSTVSHSCDTGDSKEMLVIVDQHAADERCRIEELFKELCTETNVNTLKPDGSLMVPGALTIGLEKPLSFSVSFREAELLQNHMPHFARWGILYDLSKSNDNRGQRQLQEVVVKGLPPGIIERCKIDPKLLIDLLRSEAWKCAGKGVRQNDWLKYPTNQDPETGERDVEHTWARTIHDCPQGIIDLLNSRACRSAIMFNDELSKDQCKALVSQLAECAFPFQCAHGRPSVVPLLDLDLLDQHKSSDVDGNYRKGENFGRAFKMWINGGHRIEH